MVKGSESTEVGVPLADLWQCTWNSGLFKRTDSDTFQFMQSRFGAHGPWAVSFSPNLCPCPIQTQAEGSVLMATRCLGTTGHFGGIKDLTH